jgi:alkyl hydroperoxide reductase subunit AhpC
MTGDEVGMKMRLDHVLDCYSEAGCGVEIEVDVALRIDYGSHACGGNQVRGVGQAGKVITFNSDGVHLRTSAAGAADSNIPGNPAAQTALTNFKLNTRLLHANAAGLQWLPYAAGAVEDKMSLRINDEAPNFTAETTHGPINFHEWMGGSWTILFSHPKDFTPVCTTELGYMASLEPEFAKRNCKIIGLSVDPVSSHGRWAADIEETQGYRVNYPMIGDPQLEVAKLYNMLPANAGNTSEGRTAATNATVRTVFIIGPDKKIKLMLSYPMSTGRNFDEILRVLDAMQLSAEHQVSTPVNWKSGDDVIISTSVSDEEARKQFPEGWKTLKPYLRIARQPRPKRSEAA